MEKTVKPSMEYALLFTGKPVDPPPLWPVCIGFENNRNHSFYNWDNRNRYLDEPVLTVQYTIAGSGELEDTHGILRKVLPGDVIILFAPSNQKYRLPPDSKFWEVAFITFRGVIGFSIFKMISERFGEQIQLPQGSGIQKNLQDFFNEVRASDCLCSNIYASSVRAYEFLMSLFSELEARNRPAQPTPIEKITAYCAHHLSEKIDVETMARLAGMSRAHFSRIFHKIRGETPARFLFELKMKHAEILLNTNLPVKEIVFACGFSNQSHFCRKFRERFGKAPGKYRIENLMKQQITREKE